jgi:hypothetical protein
VSISALVLVLVLVRVRVIVLVHRFSLSSSEKAAGTTRDIGYSRGMGRKRYGTVFTLDPINIKGYVYVLYAGCWMLDAVLCAVCFVVYMVGILRGAWCVVYAITYSIGRYITSLYYVACDDGDFGRKIPNSKSAI